MRGLLGRVRSPAEPSLAMGRTYTLRRIVKSRAAALLVLNLVFIGLVAAFGPGFARLDNFRVIVENMAPKAIVMGAMVMLLAAGRFDLSVDGVAALSAIVAGKLMVNADVNPLVAVLAGLAVGGGVGLLNGLAVEKLRMNPLITTLATWWACSGAALGITAGVSPYNFPASFEAIGRSNFLGLHVAIWYAIVLLLAMAVVLGFTRFGYHIYATGGNRQATRLHGVDVDRVGVILYITVAVLAAFIGIVFAARIGASSPIAVDGMNLEIIAAAVIGGASLDGGEGGVIGGLLGLLLLSMLSNAAIYVGISPYWQKAISGLVLLVAVFADALSKRNLQSDQRRSVLARLLQLRSKD